MNNKLKSSFYRLNNGFLVNVEGLHGNGSINSFIDYLGYPLNHIHTVILYGSNKINCIGFKVFTKQVIFVHAKEVENELKYSDVLEEIDKIDWGSEYSSLSLEGIFNEGIELRNFGLSFLSSVIDLIPDGKDLYKSKEMGLDFMFENDFLVSFGPSEWVSFSTKHLEELNRPMVERMKAEAALYHNNEIDIMDEVNMQTQALLNIPGAVNNEFVSLHEKQNGNINFFNLFVSHYSKKCSKVDFLLVNKGRFKQLGEYSFGIGFFIYEFDEKNILISVVRC